MDELIEIIWKKIYVGISIMCKEDSQVVYDKSKKEKFKSNFTLLYDQLSKYMEDPTKPLDRHKVAAIIIISIIKSNILTSTGNTKERIFVGNYILASEMGLSYMLAKLNEKLSDNEKIDKYFFPEAFSCPTDYFDIFYRNLYYVNDNEDWSLNPLDISERLFLLEYITVDKKGIDLNKLKEY